MFISFKVQALYISSYYRTKASTESSLWLLNSCENHTKHDAQTPLTVLCFQLPMSPNLLLQRYYVVSCPNVTQQLRHAETS